ncbi:unnamed protein product [Cutaneotrichosporon oleaginosum]
MQLPIDGRKRAHDADAGADDDAAPPATRHTILAPQVSLATRAIPHAAIPHAVPQVAELAPALSNINMLEGQLHEANMELAHIMVQLYQQFNSKLAARRDTLFEYLEGLQEQWPDTGYRNIYDHYGCLWWCAAWCDEISERQAAWCDEVAGLSIPQCTEMLWRRSLSTSGGKSQKTSRLRRWARERLAFWEKRGVPPHYDPREDILHCDAHYSIPKQDTRPRLADIWVQRRMVRPSSTLHPSQSADMESADWLTYVDAHNNAVAAALNDAVAAGDGDADESQRGDFQAAPVENLSEGDRGLEAPVDNLPSEFGDRGLEASVNNLSEGLEAPVDDLGEWERDWERAFPGCSLEQVAAFLESVDSLIATQQW